MAEINMNEALTLINNAIGNYICPINQGKQVAYAFEIVAKGMQDRDKAVVIANEKIKELEGKANKLEAENKKLKDEISDYMEFDKITSNKPAPIPIKPAPKK